METVQRMTARSVLRLGSRRRDSKSATSRGSSTPSPDTSSSRSSNEMVAPHPIPPGSEGKFCPISGLFADAPILDVGLSRAQLVVLQSDPDIAMEIQALALPLVETLDRERIQAALSRQVQLVPLNVSDGSHRSNSATRRLLHEVGLPALLRFTKSFYQKSFADAHIDQFIASHDDPHHERFALWIAEKFGDGTPWTDERRTRPKKYMMFGHEQVQVAHDRSSAHFAAWHSPKREPHKWGEHFKPDDARVWMRLHFWAARETGMFEHEAFMEYYTRFIGHFISVYSSKAPPFTRDSVRWSADPRNVQRYLEAGRMMTDVVGKPADQALAELPSEERLYTGSRGFNAAWPYEQRSRR